MSKEIAKKNEAVTESYVLKFKDSPMFKTLAEHGKGKLADRIASNFYFICKKNQSAVPLWNPQSVVEALVKCCQWELIPDNIQACLIPYKDELTFQPMYQGLLEVAYRTGIFKSIVGNVVYEGDFFEYDLGGDCYVKHQLDLIGNRTKPIAVYADVKLANGGRIVKVMTIKEVKKIQSSAKTQKVWGQYWDQMAIKTAIKQVFKLCPKSEALSEIVAYDNSLEQDFDRLPDSTKSKNLNSLLGYEPEPQDEPEDVIDEGFEHNMNKDD